MDISMGKLIGLVKKLGGGQGAGGGGGVQPDWNQNDPNAADYVKNRPYYREVKRKHFNVAFGMPFFPRTVTTVSEDWGVCGEIPNPFPIAEVLVYEILFNGTAYICNVKNDPDAGLYIGADYDGATEKFDYSEYPFAVLGGMFWTAQPGEYSLDVNVIEQHIVGDYGLISTFSANDDENGVPYLSVEDADSIAKAWKNGIPVRVYVDGYCTTVTDMSASFISMSGMGTDGVAVVSYAFSRVDGNLYRTNTMYLGNVFENGDNFPKLYINNRWHKITVNSDGTLKATQV